MDPCRLVAAHVGTPARRHAGTSPAGGRRDLAMSLQFVEEIFDIVRGLNRREGLSVLVAEQSAAVALDHVAFGYVIENGRVARFGTADDLKAQSDVKALYLGGDETNAPAGRDRPRRPPFVLGL
jgi:hypothetical protein